MKNDSLKMKLELLHKAYVAPRSREERSRDLDRDRRPSLRALARRFGVPMDSVLKHEHLWDLERKVTELQLWKLEHYPAYPDDVTGFARHYALYMYGHLIEQPGGLEWALAAGRALWWRTLAKVCEYEAEMDAWRLKEKMDSAARKSERKGRRAA